MRRLDWVAIILLVMGAIYSQLSGYQHRVPDNANPRRPDVQHFSGELWAPETKNWMAGSATPQKTDSFTNRLPHEGIIEGGDKPKSSMGSAFSISRQGIWLTARHVIQGCSTIALQTDRKKYLKVTRTLIHPTADVAMFWTNGGPDGIPVARQISHGKDGYDIGFPTGQPGAVHSLLAGDMVIRHVDKRQRQNGYRERVNAWTERSRVPDIRGSLGGLSGGAVLDERGQVIGIVQAESRRRGRIMTAQPSTISELFDLAKVTYPDATTLVNGRNLTDKDYPDAARDLILSLRVAKVFCLVK